MVLHPDQVERIRSAAEFGAEAHRGQKRKTGEPYIAHPVAAAEVLANLRLDTDTIIASVARTGRLLWERRFADNKAGYGSTGGPLVAEGVVMVGTSGRAPGGNDIVGLNTADLSLLNAAQAAGLTSSQIQAFSSTQIASLTTDALGRSVFANAIYDPLTNFTSGTSVLRNVFPNNTIPASRFDPIALKIQNLIPLPSGPNANGLTLNYLPTFSGSRITHIPAIKVDHILSTKDKLSFYWSYTNTTNAISASSSFKVNDGTVMRASPAYKLTWPAS